VRPLTIALLGPAPPLRGGIVQHTRLLREELERRHRISFFPLPRQYPKWLYPGRTADTAVAGAAAAASGHGIDWLNPLSWERAARAIRRLDPDVIIVPWWSTFWAVPYWWVLRRARKTTRARILFICHNVVPHEDSVLYRTAARIVLGLGSDHFVPSTDEEQQLLRWLPRAAVRVVPMPTFASFNTARYSRSEARARLGVDGEIVLFFGFVRQYKGLEHLIRALAQPPLMRRAVTLHVVGEFWMDRAPFDRLLKDLGVAGRVRVVDRYVTDDEMELFFAACDVVALPYTSVTGSAVAQLAAGFRRPVVASAIGDLAGAVRDGVTGFLVPPADAARLAGAIARALDRRESLQRNVEAAASERTWAGFVDCIEETVPSSAVGAARPAFR